MDELKRQELERLRHLAKQAMEKENNHDSPHLKAPEHVDHANPNSFEVADLHKLITKVLFFILYFCITFVLDDVFFMD